jgi:hypothetical protein
MKHVWDWELGKLPRGNLSHPHQATMEPAANPLSAALRSRSQ